LQSRATAALVERYIAPLLAENADTLVLGCTHYPFVLPLIEQAAARSASPVTIIDTGEAVARQLVRVLSQRQLLKAAGVGSVAAFTTGSASTLENAFGKLLRLRPTVAVIEESGVQRRA
jgi:glutamate racemase